MARKTNIKAKLVLKDIGNPKAIGALPEEQTRLVLGVVAGIANKTVLRTMPNGDTFTGLGGAFRGIPADPEKDTVSSGVLYLPGGVQELISEKLIDPETGEVREAQVEFAFEVAVVRASNPAGYSWAFKPLVETTETDPLTGLLEKAGVANQLSLAAPAPSDQQAAEAPVEKKASAAKK